MCIKTTGQFARENDIPEWRIRRIVDSLPVEVPRMGQYRVLTEQVQEQVRQRLNLEVAR